MATETLILRPTHICDAGMLTVTPGCYPTDTSLDDMPVLISEEIPDDDSSYITLSVGTCVAFTIPEKFLGINPLTATLYYRQKLESGQNPITTTEITIGYITRDTSKNHNKMNGITDFINIASQSTPNSNNYTTFNDVVPETSLASLDFNNTVVTNIFITCITTPSNSSDNSKSTIARTTQMYLEVTYEDPDSPDTPTTTETIYLKQNNSWTSVPCIIYQKQNGTWNLTDSTIFNNGDRFIVQEVT